ncbi:hypothetical protein QUF70_21875, partial [Desulfobacterales bacterium HSG17]|nr:hypothetical protein [Desulfobacterales bacterium HSG17]
ITDKKEHARELAQYLKPLKTRLNLIPYNPRSDSPFEAPSQAEVIKFRDLLIDHRVFVRVRSEKGQKIMAGCGQLGKKIKTKPRITQITRMGNYNIFV